MHPDMRPWNLKQRRKRYNMLPSACDVGSNALLGEGSGEVCALCNLNERVTHDCIDMK